MPAFPIHSGARRRIARRIAQGIAQRIVGMPAIALEESAGLYRQGFVQDVALDMTGGGEQDLAPPDAADHLAAYRDVFGTDLAMNLGLVADHQADAVDI